MLRSFPVVSFSRRTTSLLRTQSLFRRGYRVSNEFVGKISDEFNLGIDSELQRNEYGQLLCEPVFGFFDRVDELYDECSSEINDLKKAERRSFKKPGYNNEANPTNGWQCQCDITLPRSEWKGSLLEGKRIALKDTISVAGIPCENGSATFEGFIPTMDATVVSRVLEQGGTIAGKATNEDLCYSGGSHTSKPFAVRNPHDLSRHAGGSSSGCAALVAAEEVDIAINGDQGGSIRIPSSFCGVYGFKPSWSLVPYTGAASISSHFDHLGPCGRNMEDVCRLLQTLAGKDGFDARQFNTPMVEPDQFINDSILKCDSLKGKRIGILKEAFDPSLLTSDSVRNSVQNTIESMKTDLGCSVIDVSFPLFKDLSAVWCAIGYEQQASTMYKWAGQPDLPRSRLDPAVNARWAEAIKAGQTKQLSHTNKMNIVIGEYLIREQRSLGQLYSKGTMLAIHAQKLLDQLMSEHNIDVMITPTLPYTAPPLPDSDVSSTDYVFHHALGMIAFTAPFNVTGNPALTCPVGKSSDEDSMPVGMQIIGRMFDDASVLQVGTAVSKVTDQIKPL